MSKFNAPIVYNGDFAKVLKSKLKLEENVQIISANVDPTSVATDAPIGSILINQTTGIIYKKTDAGSSTNWKRLEKQALEYLGSVVMDPTGFPNRTDSTISYDDTNRIITLAPTSGTFKVYVQGVELTLGSINTTWTDTEGLWYAYVNNAGALVATQAFDLDTLIMTNALVAVWYWDATNNASIYRGDERHGISMDWATHSYLHSTFGTRYVSGLALNTFTLTSGPNTTPVAIAEAEIGSDAGVIADEDIRHNLDAVLSTASKTTYYRSGASGVWRRQLDGSVPTVYQGGSRIVFNEFTGGAWQLTEVGSNNDFMLLHAFATNDAAQPVIYILGQQEYTTTADARVGATEELNSLLLGGLPFAEFKAIGTVIYQTNDGWNASFKRCKVIEAISGGADYIDWRTSQVEGNLAGVTDHGTLSGLGDDDHLQYARTDGTRAITGSQTFNSDIKVDTIVEKTTDNGVQIEGVRLENSKIAIGADPGAVTPDISVVKTGTANSAVEISVDSSNVGNKAELMLTRGPRSFSIKQEAGGTTLTGPAADDITITSDRNIKLVTNSTTTSSIEIDSKEADNGIQFKTGAASTLRMQVTEAGAVDVSSSVQTDTINEHTSAAGVTIDSVLLKDGSVTVGTGGKVTTDTISEKTSAAGVTVDGVLLKDNNVTVGTSGAIVTDTVSEKTSAAGVTVDGVLLKDSTAKVAAMEITNGSQPTVAANSVGLYSSTGSLYDSTNDGVARRIYSGKVAISGSNSSATTISATTFNTDYLNYTEAFDLGSNFAFGTLTAPTGEDGYYMINASFSMNVGAIADANSYIYVGICVDGSTTPSKISYLRVPTTGAYQLQINALLYLTATQTVVLRLKKDAGITTVATYANANETWVDMIKLRGVA